MDKDILRQIEDLHLRMHVFLKKAKHLDTSRRWHVHISVICLLLVTSSCAIFMLWESGLTIRPMPKVVRYIFSVTGILGGIIGVLSFVNDFIAGRKQKKLHFTSKEIILTEEDLTEAFDEYTWLFLEEIYESEKDIGAKRPLKMIAFFETGGQVKAFESGQAGIRFAEGEEDFIRYIKLGSGQIGFVLLPKELTKNKKTFVIAEKEPPKSQSPHG